MVQIELPGVEEEDVSGAGRSRSWWCGGKRRLGGRRPERFHRMERSYGSFSRHFDCRLVDGEASAPSSRTGCCASSCRSERVDRLQKRRRGTAEE